MTNYREQLEQSEKKLMEQITYYRQINENDDYTSDIVELEEELDLVRSTIANLQDEANKSI